MGRELRRVPMDFDWPINEVWRGYLLPPEMSLPECGTCRGDGLTPEARAVADTFYAHQIGGRLADALCWRDKIGQAEVDHLVEKGRLRVWQDGAWVQIPRTAAEVNAEQHGPGFSGHDGINRMILVRFRCERLGIAMECQTCEGHGTVGTQEQRDAQDAWESTEPPEGEGYQLWETTSEGSPQTPVFATLDELCAYAADHCTTFASDRASAEGWKHMLTDGMVASVRPMADGGTAVFI